MIKHFQSGDLHFRRLLRTYINDPVRREAIEADIEEHFLRTQAILVLDSSGFTRTTRLHGIVHFLALVERLQRAVSPAIRRHRGRLLKAEADNIFAVFPEPDAAVNCATAIRTEVAKVNAVLPDREQIYASFGIGYGKMLVVGSREVFGDEMNLACKLGEDIAGQNQVLLTDAAFQAMKDKPDPVDQLKLNVSGLPLVAYRL